MPCHCSNCSKDPFPTYTEKFKIECLARVIAQLDDETRGKKYEIFKTKYGLDFARTLIVEVNDQRRMKRAAEK